MIRGMVRVRARVCVTTLFMALPLFSIPLLLEQDDFPEHVNWMGLSLELLAFRLGLGLGLGLSLEFGRLHKKVQLP